MRVLGGQIQAFPLVLLLLFMIVGCSKEYQEVNIIIDDFRFTPAHVHLTAEQPIRLVIRNQGRELHRFKSSVLSESNVRLTEKTEGLILDQKEGLAVHPGESLELVFFLKSGIYGFRYPIRGHRGMNGAFVVKETGRE